MAKIGRWVMGLALIAAPAMAQDALFDADGYRASSYRAPVERDPAPAQRVALAAARGMRAGRDALFVDVLPLPAPGDRASHQTIKGALWLPETGRAGVHPAVWARVGLAVARFRAGHPGAPVILFCRADCWMSWNAARHLARDGVGGVYWLAEGIEGWREAGGDLVPARPG